MVAATRTTVTLRLLAVALLIIAAEAASEKYTNHTVGDAAGWFFNSTTNKASADYSAWAKKQTFNLGDYLIFNTNTNQTVIQTYNLTTFENCTIDDSLDSDTFQYNGGQNEFGSAMTIAVPLTIEGTQYYFSDAQDGEQCLHGMAFEIKVSHGAGLPPNLNQPPPPPYAPPPGSDDEAESPPVTVTTGPNNDGGMTNNVGLCWLVFVLVGSVLFLA